MKILALSDIHENLAAVRKLRHQEENEFDAVVVAGDIGNKGADQIFEVLSTFDCPVMYVYGNHDYELDYDRSFGKSCTHLHMNMIECGDVVFAGFSGCTAQWGQNPIATELLSAVNHKYRAVLDRYAEQKAKAKARRDRKVKQVGEEHEAALADLAAKSRDRRQKPYLRRVRRLEDQRRQAEDKIRAEYLLKMQPEEAYERYVQERERARKGALVPNKQVLADQITSSGIDPRRIVIVAHERLTHLKDSIPGIRGHLFGHRHGFKHTQSKGAHYVNVSELGRLVTVYPKEEGISRENIRNVNRGTYVIIELDSAEQFNVRSKELLFEDENWVADQYTTIGPPWHPAEEAFAQGLNILGRVL